MKTGVPMIWKFASTEDFLPICELFQSSNLGRGEAEIRRRITIPLSLKQLIAFHDGNDLCGFVTFATMNGSAEEHMPTLGILPRDWRSGSNFWVVDFAARKGADGFKMLRAVTKGLGIKKARYFRHKHKEIREVRPV